MIKVYTSPSCTSCRKARAWLQENRLDFEEKIFLQSRYQKMKYVKF